MNHQTTFFSGKLVPVAACSCLAILATIFVFQSDDAELQVRETPIAQSETVQDEPADGKDAAASPTLPGIEKKQAGFDFDAQMKLKLKAISEAYAEQIKYPAFSVPIQEDELASKYLPDMPIATELPADMSNPDGPSLSILPSKFRYFTGDELSATAQIQGLAENAPSDVTGRLLIQGKAIGFASVTADESHAHHYHLSFDPLALGSIEWKENITMEVEFHLPDEIYTRSITVEYLKTIAQVEDAAASEVQGEYLLIPIYVSTEKPGFHRLQANLYDATSGKPLVHLTAEDKLAATSGVLTLRAHISALKAAGSEGPYQLKDLMLRRLPSEPDYVTEFGRIEQVDFAVEGHRFSNYQDKPYHNEKAQRIANELRKLGS